MLGGISPKILGSFFMLELLVGTFFCILAAILAIRKNRSAFIWGFVCLILPFCVFFLMALWPKEEKSTISEEPSGQWRCPICGKLNYLARNNCKKCHALRPGFSPKILNDEPEQTRCPLCQEDIRVGAVVCKHCKRDLDEPAA